MRLFIFSIITALFAGTSASGATMIPTQEAITRDKETVFEFMARSDVRSQLQEWGVSAEEAERRVAGLTPAEIESAADQIESMPAAGDDGVYIGFGTLLIIILAVLLF